MLRWTKAGAVNAPTTVQIRLAKNYEQRVPAGAPHPSRRLLLTEIKENLHYFRHTLDTPITTPCSSITLSGLQEEDEESIAKIAFEIQKIGFHYSRAHVDTKSAHLLPSLSFAHHISLSIHHEMDQTKYNIPNNLLSKIQWTIVLNTSTISSLHKIIDTLTSQHPFPITLLYPFPLNENIIRTAPSIEKLQKTLQTIKSSIPIVGIPQCLSMRTHSKRTSNRWYVDADHQKEQALLFFPDLLRYYKSEACRFCSATLECDGFFAQYLNEKNILSPLE